ncbi:MAG: hypothetical protein KC442_08295 [Thermomicrobiales bacterium]|nr:hypothetical protein [Thermomicrobiales bacterium]
MRRSAFALGLSGVLLGGALLLAPAGVLAHESRDVLDGQYHMVVGFMNEPVFAGDKSGLEFWVTDVSAATPGAGDEEAEGAPVDGLEETLKAEVIYEDQTMELPLSGMWNDPAGYYSVFFPTEWEGDYSFRIYGTINGTEIDETFTSGPETFGPVENPEPLRFPTS